jgi:hypothetical protein
MEIMKFKTSISHKQNLFFWLGIGVGFGFHMFCVEAFSSSKRPLYYIGGLSLVVFCSYFWRKFAAAMRA